MTSDSGPNTLAGLILGRRSVRVYSPGAVTDGQVKQLLEAAMAAPSAMAKDPWRFIDVEDKNTLAALGKILPGGGMLPTAARAIVVCGDLDAAMERNLAYMLQDCSAAIENLLICAHALGLGACWVGVHPYEPGVAQVRGLFGLPAPILPVAVISLGIPGERLDPRTRYRAEFVRKEKW